MKQALLHTLQIQLALAYYQRILPPMLGKSAEGYVEDRHVFSTVGRDGGLLEWPWLKGSSFPGMN